MNFTETTTTGPAKYPTWPMKGFINEDVKGFINEDAELVDYVIAAGLTKYLRSIDLLIKGSFSTIGEEKVSHLHEDDLKRYKKMKKALKLVLKSFEVQP